jgi:K+ transporter
VVLSFQSSSALASAYGIAVTGTMIVDTILVFIVIQELWQWRKSAGIAFLTIFLTVDFLFLSSNSLKIPTGGWLPLVIGCVLFLMMTTWIQGRAMLAEYMDERRMLFEDLEDKIKSHQAVIAKGSAIYLAKSLHGVPQVFLHNFEHNHVLHEQIVVLTIVTKDEPYVDVAHRIKVRAFGRDTRFYRIKLYYGFQQSPDVRQALEQCVQEGLNIDYKETSFFIGSERLSFRKKKPHA